MRITIEFGWDLMDVRFFIMMFSACIIHMLITIWIFEFMIDVHWWWIWRGWFIFYIIWIPFFLFIFWYMIVMFPIGQGWVMRFFYFRYQYRIIDISFTWFWDFFFTILDRTIGYKPKSLYWTYEREEPILLALKNGCRRYRRVIIGAMEENKLSRQRNQEWYTYWFSNRRGDAWKKHEKSYAAAIYQNEILIKRHTRFIDVIEKFADDALARKRPVSPKKLVGVVNNLNREWYQWKKTFIIHTITPAWTENLVPFGPEVYRKSIWLLIWETFFLRWFFIRWFF